MNVRMNEGVKSFYEQAISSSGDGGMEGMMCEVTIMCTW